MPLSLRVEYAELPPNYGILFKFGLFCEYINLAYLRIHVIYRVDQAEYVIRILVAAPQEYVNNYSTRRPISPCPGGRRFQLRPTQHVLGALLIFSDMLNLFIAILSATSKSDRD